MIEANNEFYFESITEQDYTLEKAEADLSDTQQEVEQLSLFIQKLENDTELKPYCVAGEQKQKFLTSLKQEAVNMQGILEEQESALFVLRGY